MTFSLKNSFTGGTTGLSNGYSYGNNIQGQLGIGQRANDVSGNTSSSYKAVKSTDKSEPKKYPMRFLFGNREITFYTPYSLWMPEEKFQQMQQEKERSKQFSAQKKTAMQGHRGGLTEDPIYKQPQDQSDAMQYFHNVQNATAIQQSVWQNGVQATGGMNNFGRLMYGKDKTTNLSASEWNFAELIRTGVEKLGESNIREFTSVNGMDDQLSEEEFQSGLKSLEATLKELAKIEISNLTGAARRIFGILSVVKGHPVITSLYIVLGLCIAAQNVQAKRKRIKGILEKKWGQEVAKLYLKDQVPKWFAQEAALILLGDMMGKVNKLIVETKGARVIVGEAQNEYTNLLDEMRRQAWEMNVSQREINDWEAELKKEYSEEGLID